MSRKTEKNAPGRLNRYLSSRQLKKLKASASRVLGQNNKKLNIDQLLSGADPSDGLAPHLF